MQNEIFHVAIGPPKQVDDKILELVASIVNKDRYETGLLLAGRIPRIVFHSESPELAESVVKKLRELKLVCFSVADSELRKTARIFRANSIRFEEQALIFSNRVEKQKRLEFISLFLVIVGKTEAGNATRETTYRTKINLTQTILTGIPSVKRVKTVTEKESIQSLDFTRFYRKDSLEPVADIMSSDLDYSFLGEKMTVSSTSNFGLALKKLKDLLPGVIFDENLKNTMLAGQNMLSQSIDINCKLICMCYREINK